MSEENSYKILMIEDQEEISSTVKDALESRGHSVKVIDDGLEALKELEVCENDSYNFVLLDINLPGANGWQILAKIRALPQTTNYMVIMLTGIDDDITESKALLDGADDYIVKPCTMKVLTARLEANYRKKVNRQSMNFELPFSDGTFEDLTERENEILGYIVKGYGNKEIAELTFISELTVVNHLRAVFRKLKVNTRLQAAVVAIKYGLVK